MCIAPPGISADAGFARVLLARFYRLSRASDVPFCTLLARTF